MKSMRTHEFVQSDECDPSGWRVMSTWRAQTLFSPEGLVFSALTRWSDVVAEVRAHYTGSRGLPPGKKLVWGIYSAGEHIGYIGLGEPAYKLSPRRRLGIADARPLPGTVGNFIFRRWGGSVSGSSILLAWHHVAARDWRARYGWEPIHWETMVDPSAVGTGVPGYCYRRAGYRSLGMTTGRGASRPQHGKREWGDTGRPKLVLYRGPLARIVECAMRRVVDGEAAKRVGGVW